MVASIGCSTCSTSSPTNDSGAFTGLTTVNSGDFALVDGSFASATVVNAGAAELIFDQNGGQTVRTSWPGACKLCKPAD